jgi:hypothetical protein
MPSKGGSRTRCNPPILAVRCQRTLEHALWLRHIVDRLCLSYSHLLINVSIYERITSRHKTYIPSSPAWARNRCIGDARPELAGEEVRKPPGSRDIFTHYKMKNLEVSEAVFGVLAFLKLEDVRG